MFKLKRLTASVIASATLTSTSPAMAVVSLIGVIAVAASK